MRDRLIELIRIASEELTSRCVGDCGFCADKIADYLLANGVIVPPCKVGDKVYLLINGFDFVAEGKIKSITKYDVDIAVVIFVHGYFEQRRTGKDFGKTVFLTKEEAEQALKEGGEG